MTKASRNGWVVAIILIISTVFLTIPPASSLILNVDLGNQLSKGWMILQGKHPFVDYHNAVYGPLVFYGSAVATWLSDGALIGEIVRITFGWGIAYVLLFHLLLRVTSSIPLSLIWLTVALYTMPVFYKYYIMLAPLLAASGLWFYAHYQNKKSAISLFVLALCAVLTGSYRIDNGVYAVLGAVTLLCLLHWRSPKIFIIRSLLFGFTGLLLISPYLLFLCIESSSITELVYNFYGTAQGTKNGMALAIPSWVGGVNPYHPVNNFVLLYHLCYLLPWITLGVALWHYGCRNKEQKQEYAFIAALSLLAGFGFLQAMHRTDISHLQQVFALQFLLFAWLVCKAGKILPSLQLLPVVLSLMFATLFIPVSSRSLPQVEAYLKTPLQWPQTIDSLLWKPQERLDKLAKRKGPAAKLAQVALAVRNHSEKGDAVLFLPYQPQMYFFSERSFATDFGWLHAGRFSDSILQDAFVQDMLDTTSIIATWNDHCFDNQAERCFHAYGNNVLQSLQHHTVAMQFSEKPRITLYVNPLVHKGP